MWLQFNGSFSIFHCFGVITYENGEQNSLFNSSDRYNRTRGEVTIAYDELTRLAPLQQRSYLTTTALVSKFLCAVHSVIDVNQFNRPKIRHLKANI